MTRRDYRALLWGAGILSACMLLVEVLSFRLAAATAGHDLAMVVGLTWPAAVGLGAMWAGRRKAAVTGATVGKSAAHRTALAGALAVAGAIGVTWASQRYARGEAGALDLAVALSSLLLPGFASGAAMGLVMRRAARVIGRAGFSVALGAVVGCALLPLAMWAGAPRALLSVGMFYAAAAFALAWVGRSKEPHWAVMATLPLAVVALVAGDVGDRWLDVRTDAGRHTNIRHWSWTEQGVVGAAKISGGTTSLQIDRSPPLPLAKKRRPSFEAQDLGYLLGGSREPGPVLVIGSGGGRELGVALAHEHPRVYGVESHAVFSEIMAMDRYAAVSGHLLADERIEVKVGAGRAALRGLPRDMQHIVVLEASRFDQTAPRLLSRHDRLFTVEAVKSYLRHLRADGTLLVRLPVAGMESAYASIREALGGPTGAEERIVVCRGQTRAVLLVVPGEMSPPERHEIHKRCRRSRLEIVPPQPPRGGREDAEARAEYEQAKALLESASPTYDDRPFLAAAPPLEQLEASIIESARSLVPETSKEARAREDRERRQPSDQESEPRPQSHPAGIVAVGLLGCLVALLLGPLWPPPRSRDRGRPVRTPASLKLSFPFLGAALALCMFALSDRLLRVAGDPAFAWTLIIPVGLVGVGSGRLWVDTLGRRHSRRSVMLALAIALVWLLLLHVVGERLEGLASRPEMVRLALSGLLLLISGFLLGFPMAAGLRFVGEWDAAPLGWCWGVHQAGWALGGALAALLVRYVGIARLWPLGLAVFALGAVLLTVGARRSPPARWYLRRVR